MGIIIIFTVCLCLFIICAITDNDCFGLLFLALTIIFFFIIVGTFSVTNDNRTFIKDNYDDLNYKISNNHLSLKDVKNLYEVNRILEDQSELKNNWFVGAFHSKVFDRPIIEVSDFCFKDSVKVDKTKTDANGYPDTIVVGTPNK